MFLRLVGGGGVMTDTRLTHVCEFHVFLCVGWWWSGLCFMACGCVTVSPCASPPTRGSLPVMRIDMLGCGWVSVGV